MITGISLLLSPQQWEITLDISFHVNRLGSEVYLTVPTCLANAFFLPKNAIQKQPI